MWVCLHSPVTTTGFGPGASHMELREAAVSEVGKPWSPRSLWSRPVTRLSGRELKRQPG